MSETTIGRYRLIRLLGKGSSGEVFLAKDPSFDREVALKTLVRPQGMPDEKFDEERARFNREAKISGRLQHPNIISVFEFGQDAERLFMAMEYVSGGSLASRMGAQVAPLTVLDRIRITQETAEAIAHAHERGVLHRDIKPANILLTSDGHVKVSDFGIGKILHGDADLTAQGVMLGSPAYMSPEQIRGEKATFQSDIYSFGVVAYQLFSGQKPFPATSLTTLLLQILHEDPPSLLEIDPTIPPEVVAIVERCISKDPENRYPAARQVSEELRKLAAALETAGSPLVEALPAHVQAIEDGTGLQTVKSDTPASQTSSKKHLPDASSRLSKSQAQMVATSRLPRSKGIPTLWVAGGASAAAVLLVIAGLLVRARRPDPATLAPPVTVVPSPTAVIPLVVTPVVVAPVETPPPPLTFEADEPDPRPDLDPGIVRYLGPLEARRGVYFGVQPGEARVFLGRRFLGLAREWMGPGKGRTLILPIGRHWARIAYPGRKDIIVDITIDKQAEAEFEEINVILVNGKPWGPLSPPGGYPRAEFETQGWITLSVTPLDTKILIDGKLVGTVEELQAQGIMLKQPGFYQVSLVAARKRRTYSVLVSPEEAPEKVLELKADL